MATPRALRAVEPWALSYKRTWRVSVVSSFLGPVLFLAAMGLGLGGTIDDGGRAASLGGVRYLVFMAPGLLAATAMQTGAGEAMYPVMGAIKWMGTYKAMLATPLGVRSIVAGHLTWITVRLALVSSVFLAVTVLFGAVDSPRAIAAVPAAVLAGAALAAPVMAFSASRDNDYAFAGLQRFVIIPMFLFSGTFFPISQLPAGVRPLAWITPLWHGVELCRGLTLGTLGGLAALGHVAYLVVLGVAGFAAALVTYRRRLTP